MSTFLRVANLPLALRSQYLASLPEPQEWFLEELVRSGEVWELPGEAYAVFHGVNLVEFFAVNSTKGAMHLSALVRQKPFKKGLCKSFDYDLIDAVKTLGWTMDKTGFLFRKRNQIILNTVANFQLAKARATDLGAAWAAGRDFFASRDEVDQIFQADGLWIAFKDGHLVGSGVMTPIDETGNVMDIGMVVQPSHRNKGFASLIVSGLANVLESEGKRPICGCAHSNPASKAALEKAGFVSEHRLVQMNVPDECSDCFGGSRPL